MTTGLQNRAVTVQRLQELQQLRVDFPQISDDINDRPAAFEDWTDIEAQASTTLELLQQYCDRRNQIEPNKQWECREDDYVLELRCREVEAPPKRRGRKPDPSSLTGRLRDIPVGGTTLLPASQYPTYVVSQAISRMRNLGHKDLFLLGTREKPEGQMIEVAHIGPGQERPEPRALATIYPFGKMHAGDAFTVQNVTPSALASIRARIYQRNRMPGTTRHFRVDLNGNDATVTCFTRDADPAASQAQPQAPMKVLPIVRALAS